MLDRINRNYLTADARAAALAERERMVPMGFMGDAWDTAWAAVYLASDEAKYVTATEFTIDGGITAGQPLDWRDSDAVEAPIDVPDAEARSVPHAGERLKGKVAIVVGAGSLGPGLGNGKASAILFARARGCLPSTAISTPCVKRRQSSKARAAIAWRSMPMPCRLPRWSADVSLNVKPAFLACKTIIPIMERQGGGVFVNTASTAGISVPEHPMISYQTGKAGLIQFSHGVALEYARKNIRSNCLIPGKIKTPMTEVRQTERSSADDLQSIYDRRARSVPLGRMGEARDVGYAALYLASDEARYVTATEILVDGGLTANCC